jgi:hypothetical protein
MAEKVFKLFLRCGFFEAQIFTDETDGEGRGWISAVACGTWILRALEHFQKYCSRSAEQKERAVFLRRFVSAQSQGFTCSFAKASRKRKNPRSETATVFLQTL